jgi:hypothetical protein
MAHLYDHVLLVVIVSINSLILLFVCISVEGYASKRLTAQATTRGRRQGHTAATDSLLEHSLTSDALIEHQLNATENAF